MKVGKGGELLIQVIMWDNVSFQAHKRTMPFFSCDWKFYVNHPHDQMFPICRFAGV